MWTEERVETLKRMWAEGKTASDISNALQWVTRNAVLGKVHRLGLPARPSPINKTTKCAKLKKQPEIRDIIDWPIPKDIVKLKDFQCHYPLKTKWCGKEHDNKKPYCDKHMEIVYRKVPWKDMYKEAWQNEQNN